MPTAVTSTNNPLHNQLYEERLRTLVPLSEIEARARNLFLTIDSDKDHSIDAEDMANYLKANGIFFNRKDFQDFMKRYDTNNSGSLDWLEFWTFVKEQENHIRRVFSEIDINKSGELEEHEFVLAIRKLGIPATRSQVRDLLEQISHDPEKKRVTYAEWYDFLHTNQFFGNKLSHITLGELWEDWKIRRANSIIIDVIDLLLEDDDEETFVWSHPKWKYMVGGAIAASVSRTITAPLDRLRCLLQIQTMTHAMKVAETGSKEAFRWKSSWEILKDMGGSATNDKWTTRIHGYYRGNMMAVAKVAPEIAVRNFIFEHLKGLLVKINPETSKAMDLQWHQRFFAIGLSAVLAQSILYPFEYMKTAMQCQEKGFVQIIRSEMKAKGGLRHMYTGLPPSLVRVAGDISIYETFKKIHYERNKAHEDPERRYPSVTELLAMGSSACAVSQTVTYPLLFIRTVIQAQGTMNTGSAAYKGTADAFKQIIKREGIRGLYRGWFVNLLKTVPSVTTTFVCYDLIKRQMGIYY